MSDFWFVLCIIMGGAIAGVISAPYIVKWIENWLERRGN